MIDKSWMLNPQAIRHAKTCIHIIKERTNQKLKLSQTDFFQQLESFSKKLRSVEFIAAHQQLMAMAKSEPVTHKNTKNTKSPIVSFLGKTTVASANPPKNDDSVEMVNCGGRHYPKWQAGKTFHGIYRGQPQYQ